MNKVAAFALQRKNSILSMSEKMFCPPQPLRLVWITPAYAGKRLYLANRKSQVKGSPPRVRGKGHRDSQSDYQRGITPACAGKRLSPHFRVREFQDHPRVCGEKLTSVPVSCFAVGSPPPVRGKVINTNVPGHGLGITPACAGKSVRRENSSS